MTDRTIDTAVTITLFFRFVRNDVWVTATMKLSIDSFAGQNTGVAVMIWLRGLSDVTNIQ